LLHALAAHAEEFQGEPHRSPGGFLAKRLDQLSAVKFARSLSRGDKDSHVRIMTFGYRVHGCDGGNNRVGGSLYPLPSPVRKVLKTQGEKGESRRKVLSPLGLLVND
jgi:hypothetical protein